MDNKIFTSLPPEKLLALAAWGEAANEGVDGMMAVINVIINRTRKPSTYADAAISSISSIWHGVVLKAKQFSCFNSTDPQRVKLEQMASAFDSYTASDSRLMQAYNLAQMAVTGLLADNTGGATHYFNPSIVFPSWASTLAFIGNIGHHAFYSAYAVTERLRQGYQAAATTVTEISEDISTGYDIIEDVIEKNPTTTLLILMGIGFAGSMIIRRY